MVIWAIVYWIGVVIAIWSVADLFINKDISVWWKIPISLVLLFGSWVGWAIYFMIIRSMLPDREVA